MAGRRDHPDFARHGAIFRRGPQVVDLAGRRIGGFLFSVSFLLRSIEYPISFSGLYHSLAFRIYL